MASADPQAAIRLDSVRFAWPSVRRGGGFRLSVEHFSAAPGETVFLAGASGSGKSTLLSLIAGVIAPTSGSIEVAGTRLDALSAAARDRFRAETIGVIFQSFNLLPYASPLDNVLLPLTFAPRRRARAGDAETAARRLMAALGLPREAVEASSAAALSVGQQQRVAVARALIGAPPIIIADEPTSALDAAAQAAFLDLLFEQAGLAKATLLMVSHDRRLAERFDRVVELSEIARTSAEEAAA